jgi:pimeloyl-ACP methyl ester carboxylesterase
MAREPFAILERAMLPLYPVFWGAGVVRGDGLPVLLVPGLTAADDSMLLLAAWLRRSGYAPVLAGVGANVGCCGDLLERLERRMASATRLADQPTIIIGQSRGGLLARALAVRAPTSVRGIITLGSPLRDPYAVHPLVAATVRAIGRAGDSGVPGLMRSACGRVGECPDCASLVASVFPSGVGFVSIYSRFDGVVDWRACLDPNADLIEVRSTHCGMAAEGSCFAAIASALRRFGRASVPPSALVI